MENKYKPWTLREEEHLIKNHVLSVELLAYELKRTRDAIASRIKKLKLEGKIKESKQKARKAHEIFQWEKRNTEVG